MMRLSSIALTIGLLISLVMLSGCDERPRRQNPNALATIQDAADLEDKIDAIGRDKHKIYTCVHNNDTYKDFQSCLQR